MSATFKTREAAEQWATLREQEIFGECLRPHANPELKTILDAKDAMKWSSQYIDGCGVYILFYRFHLRYIGKSKSVMTRLQQHAKSGRPFDRYTVIPCQAHELDKIERELIAKLDPPENRHKYTTPPQRGTDGAEARQAA